MERVFPFLIIVFAVLSIVLSLFSPCEAAAQGRYFNVSVQGGYQRTLTESSIFTRTSLGADLEIPFTDFFDLSVGHNLLFDNTTYSEDYRQRVMSKLGVTNFPEVMEQKEQVVDTTVNFGVGLPIRFFRPSLFAGKMWRKVCSEDTFEDRGCTPEKNTWNAGVSLSVYVTQALRLRMSYRVSPSVREDSKSTLDDQTSVGLSWGI